MGTALIVCGSRYADPETWKPIIKRAFLRYIRGNDTLVIHGDARGIDRTAGDVGRDMAFSVFIYPAQWDTYGKAAGIIRNQEMLDALKSYERHGYEIKVLAFHENIEKSRGTRDMINRAQRAGVKTIIVEGMDDHGHLRERTDRGDCLYVGSLFA